MTTTDFGPLSSQLYVTKQYPHLHNAMHKYISIYTHTYEFTFIYIYTYMYV